MPDIDSLSINITSSSQKAVTAINKIIDSLKDLNSALSNQQSLSGSEKLAKELTSISKAVNSIDANKIKNLSNCLTILSSSGTKLSKSGISQGLIQFGAAAQKANSSTDSLSSATAAVTAALNSLTKPTKRAQRSFISLASTIGHLYANFFLLIRAAQMLGRAMDYSSSMTEAANVVSVVFGKQAEKMDDFAETAIKDFGLARLAATEYASRFQAMGKTMGISADQIVSANTFIEKKISGNSRAYKELGDSVADMSINLTKLTADMASLYNQDYADVAQDMQAIFTGMTRPLRKYGLDLTQATLKEWALANGLDADIEKMSQAEKTMLRYQYVMSRAAGAMGDFQKTADTWANSMRTVKQLLQEIARLVGEALINALRPALLAFKKFLFNFLDATEKALNALGKLLGWNHIDFGGASLVDDTEDYADALDDAAGAAKKLKGQLRGIDELNNLTTNDKGGGSGSGLGGLGAADTSLWDQILDTPKTYESNVKDWFDFGRKISDAFRNGLTSIDWESVYEKFGLFGKNLGSFLNGIFNVETFKEIGSTIAKGLNSAFRFALEFGKELDTRQIGAAIGGMITNFFKDFDFKQAAETVNTWIKNFWEFFKGLFKGDSAGEGGLDKSVLLDGIKEFFGNLDSESWKTIILAAGIGIGTRLARAILDGLLVALKTGLAKKLSNPVFLKNILSGIISKGPTVIAIILAAIGAETFLSGIAEAIFSSKGLDDLAKTVEKFNIGKIIMKAFGADFEGGNAPDNFKWDGVDRLIKFVDDLKLGLSIVKDTLETIGKLPIIVSLFKAITDKTKEKQSEEIGQNIILGIVKGMANIVDKGFDMKFLFDSLMSAICGIFGIESPAKEMYSVGENIVLGILKGFDLVDFTNAMSEWWNTNVAPWFTLEKWNELLMPIRTAFKYAFQAAANFAVGALNKVLAGIENMMNGAGDIFNALIDLASKILKQDLEKWGRISLPRIATPYANGGYPQVGSLFLAGEAGSEMVGTINGKTGVVSNGEITGIADAIRSTSDTEIQLLRQQNTLLQGILNKEFGISSDSIFNSVRSSARDFTNRTGDPAFA